MAKKRPVKQKTLAPIANFLYEAGMLAKTPRAWIFYAGSGKESVAEHTNRTTYFGYTLAQMRKDKVNLERLLLMCLFHDFGEARCSDLNWVHQKYTKADEDKAFSELTATLPFGDHLQKIQNEYHDRETIESILAKEADNLDFLMSLREAEHYGAKNVARWIPSTLKRFKTEEGQALAQAIMETEPDTWWLGDASDSWWVNRNGLKK